MGGRKLALALRLLGVGWFVAICIGGGAFAGVWLDGRFGVSPVLTLVGLGAGIALAVVGMFRMLTAILSDSGENPPEERGRR